MCWASRCFEGGDLERAVNLITADPDRWVDTMLSEEYGLPQVQRSPLRAALSTFAAFVLCGAVPLLAFLLDLPAAFELSTLLTALVFFGIGTLKARWSTASWWRSGLETLTIGLVAAGLAFGGRLRAAALRALTAHSARSDRTPRRYAAATNVPGDERDAEIDAMASPRAASVKRQLELR